MKKWNLFLDDIRDPSYVKRDGRKYTLARSISEAKKLIKILGFPTHIAFDHDLGIDDSGHIVPSGYDFANWIVYGELDGLHTIPDDFTWSTHSSNPPGSANISGILSSYMSTKSKVE
jgi:hypothetical protein